MTPRWKRRVGLLAIAVAALALWHEFSGKARPEEFSLVVEFGALPAPATQVRVELRQDRDVLAWAQRTVAPHQNEATLTLKALPGSYHAEVTLQAGAARPLVSSHRIEATPGATIRLRPAPR